MSTPLVPVAKHLKVGGAWAGLRILDAVRRAFPEVTAREVFRKARRGEILLRQERCEPLAQVRAGDVLTVVLHVPARPVPLPILRQNETVETPAGPFWIVREDSALLAVGKPPGCASHPALKHGGDTLIERVRAYLGVTREDEFQPALANRLDIDTSGLVLIAKTRNAQNRLGRHLQKGLLGKRYLTLVGDWPEPSGGEINTPLLRHADSRARARLAEGDPRLAGKLQEAVTRYRTLHRLEHPFRLALLEVDLLTGRTHQIRRHLAQQGHPLAGDRRYGDPGLNRDLTDVLGLRRMFLHAAEVTLTHPGSGEDLRLRCPLPKDLEGVLRAAGLPQLPESAGP